MVEFIRESVADYRAREVAQGIARPPITVDSAGIRDFAIVSSGVVTGIVTRAHAAPVGIEGVVVEIGGAAGIVIGDQLPWPRSRRNALLTASDWTDLRADKPQEWRDVWAAYRDALRNLPEAFPDPMDIAWPEMPA